MIYRKNKSIIILLLIIIIIFSNTISTKELTENEIENNYDKILSKASIEIIDNVTILNLNGSYYEMGYQHGTLLKEQVKQNYRAIMHFAEQKGVSVDELVRIWNIMKNYIPEEYLDETQGLADGSNLTFDYINIANMLQIVIGTKLYACSGFSIWGASTIDGNLIHGRSFDYPRWIQDPITGKYVQENQILLVRKPDNGYASMAPSLAGLYGGGGINENGVVFGSLGSWSNDYSYYGTPMRIIVPMLLDKATNAEEAINILLSNRTIGYNAIISDANKNIGFVVELTKNITYVGTWNNSVESNYPFYSIKDVVRRSNLFINPDTAITQRQIYNPSSLLLMLLGLNDYYPMFIQYEALSRKIEKLYGNLDLNSSMDILREAYSGHNHFIILLLHKINLLEETAKHYGYLEAINQWVIHPKTGDMLISFADANKRAWENPVHYINVYDLLN